MQQLFFCSMVLRHKQGVLMQCKIFCKYELHSINVLKSKYWGRFSENIASLLN
jgi:hypothetical protein